MRIVNHFKEEILRSGLRKFLRLNLNFAICILRDVKNSTIFIEYYSQQWLPTHSKHCLLLLNFFSPFTVVVACRKAYTLYISNLRAINSFSFSKYFLQHIIIIH